MWLKWQGGQTGNNLVRTLRYDSRRQRQRARAFILRPLSPDPDQVHPTETD